MKNIESYHLEPIEEQKHNKIILKVLFELHKFKSMELFVSYLSQTYGHQNYDEQIKLIVTFMTEKQNMVLQTMNRFNDLKWRLNTKIACRTVKQINSIEPKVTLEISKNNMDVLNNEKIFIHSFPSVLNHIVHKLEQAFIDSKNVTSK